MQACWLTVDAASAGVEDITLPGSHATPCGADLTWQVSWLCNSRLKHDDSVPLPGLHARLGSEAGLCRLGGPSRPSMRWRWRSRRERRQTPGGWPAASCVGWLPGSRADVCCWPFQSTDSAATSTKVSLGSVAVLL